MDLSKSDVGRADYENLSAVSAIDRLAAESGIESSVTSSGRVRTRRRRWKNAELSQQCQALIISRTTQNKILKISNILITSLIIYLCLSNFYQPIVVEANQTVANGNLSEPMQFFIPTDQRQSSSLSSSIKLVGGGLQPKSEEEEEGFIMRASSSTGAQAQAYAQQLADLVGEQQVTSEKRSVFKTVTPATNVDPDRTTLANSASGDNHDDDDQRIPINLNRQQYVTHEQLSLLNASTKDEHISLAGGDQEIQPLSTRLLQKAQSPRTGMSKVSHVSSIFSGK